MFAVNESRTPLPTPLSLCGETYQTISARTGELVTPNLPVFDGAATTNLSNGIGCVPGTKKSLVTTIEVVGRTHIRCEEVADFSIEAWANGVKIGGFVLKEVPILKSLKYNLISKKYFTAKRISVIKTGREC